MINIIGEYTTNEVLLDIPYIDDKLRLYPIKIKDITEFRIKYEKYIAYSKKHFNLERKDSLLDYIILINSNALMNAEDNSKPIDYYVNYTLLDLEKCFSVVCREKISLNKEDMSKGRISFTNSDKSILIDDSNFNKVRVIVLKQNAMHEPKIFEDALEEKLAKKWMKAQSDKNKKSLQGIGEMSNLITCATSKSYEQLANENVVQFYADFYRCINNVNSLATTLFKTVSDKVTVIGYTDEIISLIYKDPYDGMYIDANSFLGGL